MSKGGNNGIKVILLGESGVGKTNLISVALDNGFNSNSQSSIHSSYFEGKIKNNENIYKYVLWDTAGQEIYRALNKIFIKGSKIIIFVYSIDNKESFEQIEFWINSAKEVIDKEKCVMALLANKSDLFEEQVIPDEDGKKLSEKYGIKFGITSACCDAAGFKGFLKELILDYIDLIGPEEEKEVNFKLKEIRSKKAKKKGCC